MSAQTNKSMSGMQLLKKAVGAPVQATQNAQSGLQKFGSTIARRYKNFNTQYKQGKLPTYAGFNPLQEYD